jgi:hypothetical protein
MVRLRKQNDQNVQGRGPPRCQQANRAPIHGMRLKLGADKSWSQRYIDLAQWREKFLLLG